MKWFFRKTGALSPFVMLSMIVHLLCGYLLDGIGPFEFCMPVSPLMAVSLTLKDPDATSPQPSKKPVNVVNAAHHQPIRQMVATVDSGHDSAEMPVSRNELSAFAQEPEQVASLSIGEHEATAKDSPEKGNNENTGTVSAPVSIVYELNKGPVRTTDEFLATTREKLTYRISLLKVPVGTAIIEAANIDGELRITARITSNAVISSFYPVEDFVETRMIKGNYLLTRVRQTEGSYRGDFGFTLMLREHKAFWVDRLANRYDYQPLPCDDVMDVVSGFYFLRNRDLEVGNPVQLHLFDSNEYSHTTIEVLRRERIVLPGSREVDTLVLHPLFKTAGFFRRTGDIMIWLTDDQFRVPVRMETTIPLGMVTAELTSAEAERPTSPPHRQSLSRR
jgi:hypothetical protein